MNKPLRVLIVEDSQDDTLLLVEELRRGGYEPSYTRVEAADRLATELTRGHWDIIFSDFTMPQFTAFDALSVLHESGIDIPFIVVSGTIGEDRAVMAMKAGAHDYVLKDNLRRLLPAVERELREALNRRDRKQAEDTVRYLAYHDPLTDLPNRIRFLEETQREIFAGLRDHRVIAMVLMDLQRFREVNDTLGHRQGDRLLRQVGARLRAALPETDLVARLGGDEFGILLPRLGARDDLDAIIRRLLEALDGPIMIEGIPVAIEASVGVAVAPDHATDANMLMQRADVALYRSKQMGREYAVYAARHDSYSPQRLALAAELRSAIEQGELVLHYQPIIDLKTGKLVAAEALVRWQHPRSGLLMPIQFIGVTEHTGLIKPLTEWVLATSLRECRAWQRSRRACGISVNLSARSLHDARLVDQVGQLLDAAGLEPERLKLEITESAIILEPARAAQTLRALNDLGVKLSIDDFGTGYSSLGHVKSLPVDEIKIDKSFVLNMLHDKSDAAIVRSVIDLSHHMNLKVVAEGVEDNRILQQLTELNCDYAQGYCISRPVPADAFAAFATQIHGKTPSGSGGRGRKGRP